MLRVHFSDADLGRIRLARHPDPLWEVISSLHRLQTRQGRWAYAGWYRQSRERLRERGLEPLLRSLLLPLAPYAAYFPDFLTPPEAEDGLAAGLKAMRLLPPRRVEAELRLLATTRRLPPGLGRVVDAAGRQELTKALGTYHDTVISSFEERVLARFEAERASRARAWLDGGGDGLLRSLAPAMIWEPPVLRIPRYPVDQDLRLEGRGLRLVPSYFCRGNPVAFANPGLTPVLVYGLQQEPEAGGAPGADDPGRSLGALLGRTRAAVLRAATTGATTGELARATGVSASAASQHATVLRGAGLLVSQRWGPHVLHSLTPAGAGLLRSSSSSSSVPRNERDRASETPDGETTQA